MYIYIYIVRVAKYNVTPQNVDTHPPSSDSSILQGGSLGICDDV